MADKTQLTLDRIFSSDEFKAESFGPARWLEDGSGYTTLEAAENQSHDEETKVKELVRYDSASGARTVLVTAAMLTPTDTEKPLILQNYDWSEDKQRLLIFTNSQRVWRQNTPSHQFKARRPPKKHQTSKASCTEEILSP